MRGLLTLTCLLFGASLGHADEQASPFEQALRSDTAIDTQEAEIKLGELRYRTISAKSGLYFVKIPLQKKKKIEVHCGKPDGFKALPVDEGYGRPMRRSVTFMRTLRETCEKHGGVVTTTDPEFENALSGSTN